MEKRGYEIRDRNYHSPYGEIDIVAVRGSTISFVEVKTRAEDALYPAQESVTKNKQRKIKQTAAQYLQQVFPERMPALQPRFDVCEVYLTKDKKVFLRLLEGAFE